MLLKASVPYLLKNRLIQRNGFWKIFGNLFILPLNREKKWDAFIKKTESLVPVPKYKIRYPKDRCAVIVELRKHPHLSYILRNIMYFLDQSWGLHIFHGTENEAFIKQIVEDWGEVLLTNLKKESFSKKDYNRLLTSIDFWNELQSEHILIFQTDSILRKRGIEEFLQYDYVGAPWISADSPEAGGNGGLSLRRRSVMLEILKRHSSNYLEDQEDIFFCKKLALGKYNVAPREVGMKFSVEEVFYHDPVGTHIPRQLCNSKQINAILLGVRYDKKDSANPYT